MSKTHVGDRSLVPENFRAENNALLPSMCPSFDCFYFQRQVAKTLVNVCAAAAAKTRAPTQQQISRAVDGPSPRLTQRGDAKHRGGCFPTPPSWPGPPSPSSDVCGSAADVFGSGGCSSSSSKQRGGGGGENKRGKRRYPSGRPIRPESVACVARRKHCTVERAVCGENNRHVGSRAACVCSRRDCARDPWTCKVFSDVKGD